MKTIERSKGTVRFALKDSVAELNNDRKRESLIMLHFNYGNLRFKYSTGFKVSLENWDLAKQRIRNKVEIVDRDYTNGFLAQLEARISKVCLRLQSENLPVTKEAIKQDLDNFTNRGVQIVEERRHNNFVSFVTQFIIDRTPNLKPVTKRAYVQTLSKLVLFEKEKGVKLNFDFFDRKFFNDFVAFMEAEGFGKNTIAKHLKNMRVFLNAGVEEGYVTSLSYKNKQFVFRPEQTTAIYLTEEEIKNIASLDLSGDTKLQTARDIFLIGCATGQRVSDYNGLSSDQVILLSNERQAFKITQQKTDNVVSCPILPEIREMMNLRYGGCPPPRMPEQHINNYLKVIGKMAGIDEPIISTKTKGGKIVKKTVPKYELITTHTARRSFCTNKYKAGKAITDIMFFSGHTTEKEFKKYIRIEKEERTSHLLDQGFFD